MVCLIVFDFTDSTTLLNTLKWHEELSNTVKTSTRKPIVFLVGTKRDLISDYEYESLIPDAIKIAKQISAELWTVSAKNGQNVEELFCRVAALVFNECVIRENRPSSSEIEICCAEEATEASELPSSTSLPNHHRDDGGENLESSSAVVSYDPDSINNNFIRLKDRNSFTTKDDDSFCVSFGCAIR